MKKCFITLGLILLHANNKDTDKPAHRRSLISAYVICSLECKEMFLLHAQNIFDRKKVIIIILNFYFYEYLPII